MEILNDLISGLNGETGVKDIRQGIFYTGVLTRQCGMAATLSREAMRQKSPLVKAPGSYMEKSPLELSQMAYSKSLLEAAIGMATINSLLDIEEERCFDLNARELIAEKGEGKRVAIIGHFPFIPKIREIAKELWVIEKSPREGDFPEKDAENLIPRAQVVAITGTSITNHTFKRLVGLCGSMAYVIVLGATTPLSPILFDHGVDAISGTRVIDPELTLRCISEGATFRQILGTRRVTMLRS
jgi:uncharacterized protein (DUF4213/DUF364 family)